MAPHQCYLQCVLLEFPAEKKQAQDRGKLAVQVPLQQVLG